MPWYYADNGKQTGPFTDEQFHSLISSGAVGAETLVWRDGMANWQPYSQVAPPPAAGPMPPIAGPAEPAIPGGVVCSECGLTFSPDQVIQIANKNVCALCKPKLVQRLTEGAALGQASSQWVNEQQLLEREYRIEIGDCLERAWKIFSSQAGLIIGATLLVGLVFIGCYIVSALVSIVIPFGNVLLQGLYAGPLTGGLFYFFLRIIRGEPATVGDAFAGFSRRFLPLFLSSLVQTVAAAVCMAPFLIVAIVGGVSAGAMRGGRFTTGMGVGLVAGGAIALLISMAALMYVTTLWTHSLLLIVDKQMNFWPAMELSRKLVSKRWWMTFLFVLVGGIISGAGFIVCGVGALVTVPLFFLMKAYLYEDNFRDLQPAANSTV